MRSSDPLESVLRKLRYRTTAERQHRTLENVFQVMDETHEQTPGAKRPGIRRLSANTRTTKFILAAAVILLVFGGVSFWPSSGSGNHQWWLAPPAARGRYITDSLDKVSALVYREGYVFVGGFGSTHTSGNWTRWYKAADRQRQDTYYNDALVSTKWEVPDGSGSILCCDVSYEFECYTTQTYASARPASDPVMMLRFYVGLLEKADRVLHAETFEGKVCVGFEISASKYSNNPKEWIDRIWFDKDTGLPVRIEHHGRPIGTPEQTLTHVQDQFQYASEVPADIFEPQIPEGFVNAHPDTIRKAREREEKGEMVFAQVPAGLREQVMAALSRAETVSYRESDGTNVSVSRYAWRRDHFDGARVRSTEWFVVEKEDWAPTSLDFNDKNFRLTQTTVDYDARTYRQVVHREQTMFRHPMDHIAFLIGLINRADRFDESVTLDGVPGFRFDVSAKKYGTNPDGAFHRVWFDAATKLPVRMEAHWPNSDGTGMSITVQEQFQWNPEWPEDYFVPRIPPEFTPIEAAAE